MTKDASVKLPDDEKLSNGEITSYVFLGDDAFKLKILMMKPFPRQGLTGEDKYVIIDIVGREGYQKIILGL